MDLTLGIKMLHFLKLYSNLLFYKVKGLKYYHPTKIVKRKTDQAKMMSHEPG